MKKSIYLLLLTVFFNSAVNAQEYNWGIGVKAGTGMTGVNVKYFIDNTNALEAIIGSGYKDGGLALHVLYERHIPVIEEGFNFYYGGGAHIYSWKDNSQFGLDGIVGLEYKITQVPIVMSIDFKPEINLFNNSGLYANTFFFGVKYVF